MPHEKIKVNYRWVNNDSIISFSYFFGLHIRFLQTTASTNEVSNLEEVF